MKFMHIALSKLMLLFSIPILLSTSLFLFNMLYPNQANAAQNFCVAPPNNMVAWWPGDNNANDIKGNNDGTFNGSYIPGKVSNAFSFSGTGTDFALIPQDASLEPAQITVDAWVKANGSPGNFKYILGKGANGCDSAASYALYTGANGGLIFYVFDGSTFALSPNAGQFVNIWDNNWHLVAGTYDGNNVSLYVDGNLIGSTQTSININYSLSNNNDLTIGKFNQACDFNSAFQGGVDEVEIFSRALSQSEIQSIYAAGSLGKCKTIMVTVDVKPDSDPACINPKSKGVIPVAVLGSATFDVATIDPSTLSLNSLSVNNVGNGRFQCSISDVNRDGYPDLVCQFGNTASAWKNNPTTAILSGKLYDHTNILGSDAICLVPPQ